MTASTPSLFPDILARLRQAGEDATGVSEGELQALADFVDEAMAMRQHLARKEDELARLRHADLVISSRLRLEETLETILQMAMEVTDARYGIFRLLERESNLLVTKAFVGDDLERPAVEAIPADGNSITGRVAVERQALLVADVREQPWASLYYPLDHAFEMRSELAAPLLAANGRLEGVINLESPLVAAFSEQDSLLLQSLATQAVIAIQEARLLDALLELSERLLTVPLPDVLARLAVFAHDLLDEPVAALAAPLLSSANREASEILALFRREQQAAEVQVSDWDRKVLNFLAHHAALAVQNAERLLALRQAQEQQAAAETFAAVGDIAANLLHRLNNKIGTIPVRVEGIQDKCAPSLAADAYLAGNLQEIERSAVEAMDALQDSLFYLRPIHLRPVDVARALAQAQAGVQIPGGISIEARGLEALPPVRAGRQRLALVFVNLLENAITAMQGEGRITISGHEQDGWVQITVRDSGPGIPAKLHDQIFDFNYSSSPHSSGKLGFGLWWTRTIIARFGGSIDVQSDGKHGTAFIFRLPVAV